MTSHARLRPRHLHASQAAKWPANAGRDEKKEADDRQCDRILGSADGCPVGIVAVGEIGLGDLAPARRFTMDALVVEFLDERPAAAFSSSRTAWSFSGRRNAAKLDRRILNSQPSSSSLCYRGSFLLPLASGSPRPRLLLLLLLRLQLQRSWL